MNRLLYIKASPRGDRSYSIAVADAFIEAYRVLHPEDEIDTLDLFRADLPPFDGAAISGRYNIMRGLPPSEEEQVAWRAVEAVVERFKAADKVLMAVPMWNFSIPYRLKQYLDNLVQPGLTFGIDPDKGYYGLVTGKPIAIIYASGGAYGPDTGAAGYDFQKPYLEFILGFIGFTDIRTVAVAPTLAGGPEAAARVQDEAKEQVRRMAAEF